MIRVGIIGAGKIGGPVAQAIKGPLAEQVTLAGVLTSGSDVDGFFAEKPDVVIEAAGTKAVAAYGARALQQGDLWITSGAALADGALCGTLTQTAEIAGTNLRVLSGAIAGLDGVRTAAADPDMTLHLTICLAPADAPRETVFRGTVADAAMQFPADVNVAVAAALAGHGSARTTLDVIRPSMGEPRDLRLSVRSIYGDFDTISQPKVVPPKGIHTVAANIISALQEHGKPLRVY